MKRLTLFMTLLLVLMLATVCVAFAATAGGKGEGVTGKGWIPALSTPPANKLAFGDPSAGTTVMGGTATARTENGAGTYAMSKKPAEENREIVAGLSGENDYESADTSLDAGGGTTLNKTEDNYDNTKADADISPHINENTNRLVVTFVIPLLAILFFTIWKWDQARFTRLLLQIWGVIKDTDNYFANPTGQVKTMIEIDGLNKAKKQYAINKIKETLSPDEVNTVVKKTGTIGNAIELAMTTFKYAPTLIKGIGSLIKLIK